MGMNGAYSLKRRRPLLYPKKQPGAAQPQFCNEGFVMARKTNGCGRVIGGTEDRVQNWGWAACFMRKEDAMKSFSTSYWEVLGIDCVLVAGCFTRTVDAIKPLGEDVRETSVLTPTTSPSVFIKGEPAIMKSGEIFVSMKWLEGLSPSPTGISAVTMPSSMRTTVRPESAMTV